MIMIVVCLINYWMRFSFIRSKQKFKKLIDVSIKYNLGTYTYTVKDD